MKTAVKPWWEPWVLSTSCGSCKAPVGQPCDMRYRKTFPFHVGRIDKGVSIYRKRV